MNIDKNCLKIGSVGARRKANLDFIELRSLAPVRANIGYANVMCSIGSGRGEAPKNEMTVNRLCLAFTVQRIEMVKEHKIGNASK